MVRRARLHRPVHPVHPKASGATAGHPSQVAEESSCRCWSAAVRREVAGSRDRSATAGVVQAVAGRPVLQEPAAYAAASQARPVEIEVRVAARWCLDHRCCAVAATRRRERLAGAVLPEPALQAARTARTVLTARRGPALRCASKRRFDLVHRSGRLSARALRARARASYACRAGPLCGVRGRLALPRCWTNGSWHQCRAIRTDRVRPCSRLRAL